MRGILNCDFKDSRTIIIFSLLKILQDCFICDECNEKLESSFSFKQQCVEVYRKIHATYKCETIDQFDEQHTTTSSIEETSEMFIIGDNDALITEEDDKFVVSTEKQYEENIYLEFEEHEEVEENQFLEEEPPDERKSNVRGQPTIAKQKNVMSRKSYTVEKKLEIIEYAEKHNNRVAARLFDMNESSVRCFRRQKEILLKMSPQKKTNRRAFPHWPNLESELREFVINHPKEHGTKAKLKEIRNKAIEIAAKHEIDNFNGSNSYIFKFMQRHQLPSASPRPRKNRRSETESF